MAVHHARTSGDDASPAGPSYDQPVHGQPVFDALVLDAGSRQGLAVTRSLGRAGLCVAVAECFADCDPGQPVLSFHSRYAAHRWVPPNLTQDEAAYADAVVDFCTRHRVRVVVPGTDGSIAALLPRRADLEATGAVLALSTTESLLRAGDKARTLAVAETLGIAGPETVAVDDLDELSTVAEKLGLPFVLKPVTSWSADSSLRLQATVVRDLAEARRVAGLFAAHGVGALGQTWVGGRREGVSLLMADGVVRAAFAHVEHRTTPTLGGASVVRESIDLPADTYDASVALVRALGLDGLAEVEFRRDRAGRPVLMEVNARLPGLIGSAVACGLDLPLLMWQWAVGSATGAAARRALDGPSYRVGRRMRWLRGDMRWLRDNQRDAGSPDAVSRLTGSALFAWEFVRSSHYDCFDARDLGPTLAELRTTVSSVRRSVTPTGRSGRVTTAVPSREVHHAH